MPRRSRPLIGRNTAASRRYRNARAIETPLQSETRRALRRLRYSEARIAATQTMQVPVQRIQLWTHKPFSGLQYNAHIDYKADSSVDIGQMSRVCQFCSALGFRDEPFGLCCKQEVKITCVKEYEEMEENVPWIFQGLISTLQLVKKLDRYPFRKKRKIDSVEQEETTMTIKKEATNQVGLFFIQHLPRNPSMFSGEGSEDPHNWLKKYERVAKHNQWDETLCLANVYFYLTGTALKWFENNEESILTWTEFMSQLKSVFGKNENLRLRAEKTLKTRAQLKGESTEFYIQDVLRLCKEVDPHMNEQDKISHLMKGIAEELYQALLPRDAHTTQQFVTECRRIEALHCKRVTPTRYERLPNVASLSDHDDRADLSSMIRQIVREEVQRALASPREEPEISAIEHMVQQEIEKTIAPISRSVPQNRAPRPLPSPRYEFQPRNFQPRPQQPKQLNGRRDTNEWGTTEGKPICFHCGRPGHVVRYCRDRRREYEGEQTWNYKQRDRLEPRTFYNSRSSQEPNDDLPRENRRRYRSPSPHTGRKGQYSSPDRRASQSPRRSRQEN
ncbi:hypothetical protein LAZ67_12002147 [Cordylochernes scorpioides]|uniref:CCHC-type domain-containing protein n=1 Tax=Cordylochernes scorpioides TaxID=51811 RepID=A0ABY6L543_9ARAC|nr:hypothetical protein LAZ67_12002147 [Cordylochernes scorpioides]